MILGCLAVLGAGCDGSGVTEEQCPDGGAGTIRGQAPSQACSDAGMTRPTTVNPCVSVTGCTETVTNGLSTYSVFTCGWNSSSNVCYATPWCEPSVASDSANAAYNPCTGSTTACVVTPGGNPSPIRQRPQSASCNGASTYTYKAGTLMVWGVASSAAGSAYSSPGLANDGYLCVPNSQDITINC